jgi:hypothetical protein
MSDQIQVDGLTGQTVYSLVRNALGAIWNGTAFVTYVTANYATYPIAMTEQGSHSGYYAGTFPTVAAGEYEVVAKQQAGGSPAETDATVGNGTIVWDGTQFSLVGLLQNTINCSGPVDPITGNVTIIGGDAYTAANGRPLLWNAPVGNGIPDLTGATLVANFYKSKLLVNPTIVGTATALNAGGSSQQVQLSLQPDDSAAVIGCTLLAIVAYDSSLTTWTVIRQSTTILEPSNLGVPRI